jgi:hypothetical protein
VTRAIAASGRFAIDAASPPCCNPDATARNASDDLAPAPVVVPLDSAMSRAKWRAGDPGLTVELLSVSIRQ